MRAAAAELDGGCPTFAVVVLRLSGYSYDSLYGSSLQKLCMRAHFKCRHYAAGTKDGFYERSKPEKHSADKLVRVTFQPEGRTVEFEFGTMPTSIMASHVVLDVAENHDVFLDHACGGVCACTTCHCGSRISKASAGRRRDWTHGHGADQQLNSRSLPGRHHPPRRLRGRDSKWNRTTSPKAAWPGRRK